MELKAGKGASERPGPDWKAALQREREEQQHLLAESYSAVMELTRQLQISERHWSQEKLQLVERLQAEKQQVEQQVKELQNRLSQVRLGPDAQAAEALAERRGPGGSSARRGERPRWFLCSEIKAGELGVHSHYPGYLVSLERPGLQGTISNKPNRQKVAP